MGGDAIDYNAIANQESLSGMETELLKLTTIADEILDELEYMKTREMRLSSTHGAYAARRGADCRFDPDACTHLRVGLFPRAYLPGGLADRASAELLQT